MQLMIVVGYSLFLLVCGYALGTVHTDIDKRVECGSFTKHNAKWVGYFAMNDANERRCFWLENRYPYRVMQGVNVNGKD